MRSVAAAVGASLAASALIYFVLAATEALPLQLRLGAMALVLVLGIVIAWPAPRGARQDKRQGTSVGYRVKAKGDVTVKDVNIEPSEGDVRVADDLRTDGKVAIQNVRIGRHRDR